MCLKINFFSYKIIDLLNHVHTFLNLHNLWKHYYLFNQFLHVNWNLDVLCDNLFRSCWYFNVACNLSCNWSLFLYYNSVIVVSLWNFHDEFIVMMFLYLNDLWSCLCLNYWFLLYDMLYKLWYNGIISRFNGNAIRPRNHNHIFINHSNWSLHRYSIRSL